MKFLEQNLELSLYFVKPSNRNWLGPVFACVIHQDGLKIRRFMLFTLKKLNQNRVKNMESNEIDVASYYKRKTKKNLDSE